VYVYACVSAHILYLNFNPFLCCCLSAWLAIILCYPFYAVCPLPAVLLLLDCANIIPAVSALLCLCLVVNTFCGTFVSLLGFFAVYVMYPHPPLLPPSLNLLRAHVCEWINTCIRAFMRMCMLLAGSAFTIAFCLHYTVDTMWCLLILLQLVHPVHNTPRCRRRCCCCFCFCRHTQTQYNTLSFALAIVALRNQCALSRRWLGLQVTLCFACLCRSFTSEDRLWLPFCLPISFIFTFTQNGVWLNLTIVWFRLVWFFCSGSALLPLPLLLLLLLLLCSLAQ